MNRRHCGFVLAIVFVTSPGWLVKVTSAETPSEGQMAARIDTLLEQSWRGIDIQPAARSTDAEFLRRAWLDLCGIIPPINDDDGICGIRNFLDDDRPDKRARLITALLANRHATHFANAWKNVMLPSGAAPQRFGRDTSFTDWLQRQFADNVPYDEMVRELLLASGGANQVGPALFFTSLELKPENLAASTSRIFLGTQIQCAQCHDHPFDVWKQEDFWGYAAFFAQLQRPTNARPNQPQLLAVSDAASGELRLPDSDEVVPPKFLGGAASPDAENAGTRRERLAAWLTSGANPYFARATVNRVWAMLYGRGLVDPIDDMGQHNPASHPELLDELTAYFAETQFDVNRLVRTLTSTEAYHRSSRSKTDAPPELFTRMALKTLTAEQLYDCLAEAMRRREDGANGAAAPFRGGNRNRQMFLAKFRAPTQGATDYQAGIPQALTLMNGVHIRQATDLAQSDLLIALSAPFFSDEKRVETLFLSTLSRRPTTSESETFVTYVTSRSDAGDRNKALSDVLWALLNSAEFILNH